MPDKSAASVVASEIDVADVGLPLSEWLLTPKRLGLILADAPATSPPDSFSTLTDGIVADSSSGVILGLELPDTGANEEKRVWMADRSLLERLSKLSSVDIEPGKTVRVFAASNLPEPSIRNSEVNEVVL